MEDLGPEGESSRHAPGQVRTDPGAASAGAENRTMFYVEVELRRHAIGQKIIHLRQPPQVVITSNRALLISIGQTHLVVERLRILIPHFEKPIQAEAALARKITTGRKKRRVFPQSEQHQAFHITGRLHELHVVAGVEPSAGNVDRTGDSFERARQKTVRRVIRPGVHAGHFIGEMGWLARQNGRNHIRSIPLRLKIEENMSDATGVKVRR